MKPDRNWERLLHEIYVQEENEEPELWTPDADELIRQSPTGTLKGKSL